MTTIEASASPPSRGEVFHSPTKEFSMNDEQTLDDKIRRLYALKVDLKEALYQPDPDFYEELCEEFDDLCQEIRDAGGVIPDELL
jgi:hypothetical protein